MISALRILLSVLAGATLFAAVWLAGAVLLVSVGLPGVPHEQLAGVHRWLMEMVIGPAGGVLAGWVAYGLARGVGGAVALSFAVAAGMVWSFGPELPIPGLVACAAGVLAGGWIGHRRHRPGAEPPAPASSAS